MSSILASIRDLVTTSVKLVAEIIAQIFYSLDHAVQACIGFLVGIVAMIQDVVLGLTKALGGVASFVIGNLVMLALLGGASYLILAHRGDVGPKTPAAGRRPIAAKGRRN